MWHETGRQNRSLRKRRARQVQGETQHASNRNQPEIRLISPAPLLPRCPAHTSPQHAHANPLKRSTLRHTGPSTHIVVSDPCSTFILAQLVKQLQWSQRIVLVACRVACRLPRMGDLGAGAFVLQRHGPLLLVVAF